MIMASNPAISWGAIANEIALDSKFIGKIEIYDDFSMLDLPSDVGSDKLQHLQAVRVAGQALRIARTDDAAEPAQVAAKPVRAARPSAAPVMPNVPNLPTRAAKVPASQPDAPARLSVADSGAPAATAAASATVAAPAARPAKPASLDAVVAQAVQEERELPAEPPKKVRTPKPPVDRSEKFDTPSPAKAARTERTTERTTERAGEYPMQSFRVEVGKAHGAKPANLVGGDCQ